MVTAEGNVVTVKYEGDFSPAFVLNVLAARPASIVDMKTVMANEVDGDMGNAWLNANAAGSGPFKLDAYRPAQLVRMSAHGDYFKGAPKMDSVIIRHVAESATQELMLESGDIDLARNLTRIRSPASTPAQSRWIPSRRQRYTSCRSTRKPTA